MSLSSNSVELSRYEPSFTVQDWNRLRDTYKAISASQKALQDCSTKMESSVVNNTGVREYASLIQNKQIHLRILKDELLHARRRLRNTQLRFSAFIDKIVEEDTEEKRREEELTNIIVEISRLKNQNEEMRHSYCTLINELVLRRRFMIYGLCQIFFPEENSRCIFKKKCLCDKFDAIRGLHLAQMRAQLGHSENESAAALGIIVLMLVHLSQINGVHLKDLFYFMGSKSVVVTRNKNEILPLYVVNSRKQKERDRFDSALNFLNNAIYQLRSDAGILTTESDRPIANLKEFLLICVGMMRPKFLRASSNLLSPLVQLMYIPKSDEIDDKCDSTTIQHPTVEFVERMTNVLTLHEQNTSRKSSTSLNGELPVLDVISSQNANFMLYARSE